MCTRTHICTDPCVYIYMYMNTYTDMCERVTFKVHCTFTGAIINHLKAVKELTGHVQQDKPYVILSPNDSTARGKYQVQK